MNTKYKMFRNFMHNNLGILRDDIKEWTQETIADCVNSLVGQMNILAIVERK